MRDTDASVELSVVVERKAGRRKIVKAVVRSLTKAMRLKAVLRADVPDGMA